MQIKWKKINRVIHRDLGYFFAGMVIIYSLSGMALNHRYDWNPNYIIIHEATNFHPENNSIVWDKAEIIRHLEQSDIKNKYKSHFNPSPDEIRIFLDGESTLTLNFKTGQQIYESVKKRPFFYEINFLHYNPGPWWKWFSDIFAVGLIFIAITGLFILKGKNGITHRGAWLTISGIIIPVIFLLVYG